MKKLLLSLLGAAIAIIAHADTYTGTITSKVWDESTTTATINNVPWDLKTDGGYYGYNETKGAQIGSGSKPCTSATFSTEGISGTITSIKINSSTASSGNCSVSVKVGDTNFRYNDSESASLTSSAKEYEFIGIGSGKISITYTNSASKAVYLKQIQVEYTTVAKEQVTLTWSKESETILFGDEFSQPTLTITPEAAASSVVYESSNPDLLKVDNTTGEIIMTLTPKLAGTATVTASIPDDNETYMATPAEYTIIVKDPNAPEATIVFSQEGLENADVLTSFTKDPVTFTFEENDNPNGNGPKYYSNDGTARIYVKNTLTISAAEGFYITSIKAEGSSLGNITSNPEGYKNGVWNATSSEISSVVFTASGSTRFTKITVVCIKSKPAAPAAPAITIDGVEVNLDESYNLNNGSKTVVITAAEGHHIYHKFEVSAPASEAQTLAETTTDGFTHVESNTASLSISTNGTLSFYAADPATGATSDVKTLTFNGGSTGISEIEAEGSEAARWYDLQGRRVAAPAKGNVYIIKQGSKTSKRVL